MMYKKKIIPFALFLGTVVSMFFVPWPLLKVHVTPLPTTIQQQLDDALGYGFDGIIAYVDQQGCVPGLYAAGYKDKQKRVAADPQALFKIASIGKLYDAVAIAKLVVAQRLSLDATLAEYFPELMGRIEHADEITVRMMVQHRSGIPNYTDTPNFWTDPPKNNLEALERVLDLPADFEPGEKYRYSNTNYLLLTKLIERVIGCRKFEYISEVILRPLGLNNTFESIHDVEIDDVMSGYYVGVAHDLKTVDYGSMLATAKDVGTFIRALNDGTLLSEAELEIYASIYEFGHTGLIPGYQSIARYYKDVDAVVVLFTNTTDFDGYNWALSEAICSRVVRILRQ